MANKSTLIDQDINDLDQQFSQMSQSEQRAFQAFVQTYKSQHPELQKDDLGLGWEFRGAMATSIGAVLLAAFRTGQAFYEAAVYSGTPIYAFAEAFVSVLAIEGSIVFFAVRNAHNSRKTDSRSQIGLAIAFIISMFAGLFQSVHLLSGQGDWFVSALNWVLVIAMGIGATVIAWLGGDILGVQLVLLEEKQKIVNEQYSKSVRGYQANLLKEWRTSTERMAVNERKHEHYRTNRLPNVQMNEPKNEPFPTNRSGERSRTNGQDTKEFIYSLLNSVMESQNRLAGVGEIARQIMIARTGVDTGYENLKGNVSETRKKWIHEHGYMEQK